MFKFGSSTVYFQRTSSFWEIIAQTLRSNKQHQCWGISNIRNKVIKNLKSKFLKNLSLLYQLFHDGGPYTVKAYFCYRHTLF